MADVFTEDFIHTFFQGNVQIALPEATAENLATEGIEHQCDLGGFLKEGPDSAFKNLP